MKTLPTLQWAAAWPGEKFHLYSEFPADRDGPSPEYVLSVCKRAELESHYSRERVALGEKVMQSSYKGGKCITKELPEVKCKICLQIEAKNLRSTQ